MSLLKSLCKLAHTEVTVGLINFSIFLACKLGNGKAVDALLEALIKSGIPRWEIKRRGGDDA